MNTTRAPLATPSWPILVGLAIAACSAPDAPAAPPAARIETSAPPVAPAARAVRCQWGSVPIAPAGGPDIMLLALVDATAGLEPLRGVRVAELALLHPDGTVAGPARAPVELRTVPNDTTASGLSSTAPFAGEVPAKETRRLWLYAVVETRGTALGEVGGYRGALAAEGLAALPFEGAPCDGPWPTG